MKLKSNRFDALVFSTCDRMTQELAKHKYKCKCGHVVKIFPFEHITKKLCNHCKNYVYISKKEEFKDKLLKKMKEGKKK